MESNWHAPDGANRSCKRCRNLVEWSQDLNDWERDALRRIALSETLGNEDIEGITARLRHAHGLPVDGDTQCDPLGQNHLPQGGGADEATVFCSLGPVQNVDRLAPGQELHFAIDGITLVYGDNGSGKSGYARVTKKLCQARVIEELQGDVFADRPPPPPEVQARYRRANAEVTGEVWQDGQPPLQALSHIMVLDSANARVYIDAQSEIIFVPREIDILTRLGALYTQIGANIHTEAETIGQRCRGAFGAGYDERTTAGRLVRRLVTTTALGALPSEEEIHAAGAWDENKENELTALTEALKQNPQALAWACRRAADAVNAAAATADEIDPLINNNALTILREAAALATDTAQAAALSAAEQFSGEPLAQTGGAAWRRMYEYARAFAAEAGLREPATPFLPGDPCPLCQSPLDEEAGQRLQRFDDFVRSRAATEAEAARTRLEGAVGAIEALQIPEADEINRALAEYAALGDAERDIAAQARDYIAAARARRSGMTDGARAGSIGPLADLPGNPAAILRAEATRLSGRATALEAQPAGNPAQVARAAELRDAKRLSEEIDAVLARRADLEQRLRLQNCRTALNTDRISRFATQRRRDLVTPELHRLLESEINFFDLSHVPLRIAESSSRGRSFFDVALDTRRQTQKSRVLSEGEQRALGIACFMAEIGRIPGRHGIIVDDPVSSLDHQRIRKTAERLVEEAAGGRQVIIFTHNLVFYQEVLAAAAARNPQVPVLKNLIGKAADGRFGVVSRDDEPWIAKRVTERIAALRDKLNDIPDGADRATDEYRTLAKDFYSDLRETWERLVEEVLLGGVVERFSAGIKTQSLKSVVVEDEDYRVVFAAMKRVSELSGHDMAPGRQIPAPNKEEMRRDLDAIETFRTSVHRRKRELEERRRALENPPPARTA